MGFSDHSLVKRDGIKASVAALAMGADVIERHFTILPPEESRDGPVSISPDLLSQLVQFARLPQNEVMMFAKNEIAELSKMIGMESREMSEAEKLNRDYYRGRFASMVSGRPVYNWEFAPVSPHESTTRAA
ncbi:MAG: N-acetylneuraminate synthase family protein [Gammaproteobacteria bacterium]|nr:N-acetylneuraminate synthase family protein [Gammaproteobacteria bacterium]